MSVTIKEVTNRHDLKKFIDFPESLYRHNPCYVPRLFFDQVDTLDPKRNPATEFCESALYLAYKYGKVVGRVAAIVNNKANTQWNHKEVRFGWYDFIDDREVSQALMEKVEEFGRARGMESVVGPLGFTDFDPEGMLVEGYDKEGTMALIYNRPYYNDHVTAMGFEKDADWIEYRLKVPEELPDRILRVAAVIGERAKVHPVRLTRRMAVKGGYGRKIFNLINACYKDLYNFTVLPDDMADKYMNFYLSVLDLKYVSLIENENDELVAFGITMPSLARSLKKTRGRLFPFGWFDLLKNLYIKHDKGVEMLLVGVRPDYQNSGVNSLLFTDLLSMFIENHLEWAETNAILETNLKNQGQWRDYEKIAEKRRRSYKKAL